MTTDENMPINFGTCHNINCGPLLWIFNWGNGSDPIKPFTYYYNRTDILHFYGKTITYTDGTPDWVKKAGSLWWNGKRWVAWIDGLYIAEPTDFMDRANPPVEWLEGVYRMTTP